MLPHSGDGRGYVLEDGSRVRPMTDTLRPRSEKEVEEAVRWALGKGMALEIVGQGTKRAVGRPAQATVMLDLSGLRGVTLYEHEELVLSARAGTSIHDIEAIVGAHRQHLAFEPIDYGPLLGGVSNRGTLGGALAANLSGPRLIRVGAARDHFLGFSAVSGRGETFKSGGRVVKNVTGYDLCKLMAGSWGTLAALTTVTVKTLPRPEAQSTVMVLGLDDATAVRAMSAAMSTTCDVSGAAHLPAPIAARIPIGEALGVRACHHGAAARRRRALRRPPQGGADGGDEVVRGASHQRRHRLAQSLAGDPRRDAAGGDQGGDRAGSVAHCNGTVEGRRAGAPDLGRG